MDVRAPRTDDEFKDYLELRHKILRKPWGLPPGSEWDDLEETSIHRIVLDDAGRIKAVGRLQFNTPQEGQIRYVAVDYDVQGKGFGKALMLSLEEAAIEGKAEYIKLQSRMNAVRFYLGLGYSIYDHGILWMGCIPHFWMRKYL